MPDDGRSRAVQAMIAHREERRRHSLRTLDRHLLEAALASGEVVLREDADRRIQEVERKHMERANEDTRRWEAFHQTRVRELEAALRPFADLDEHCARFGITQTALVNVPLLDRARAALEGSEGAVHA